MEGSTEDQSSTRTTYLRLSRRAILTTQHVYEVYSVIVKLIKFLHLVFTLETSFRIALGLKTRQFEK